MWLCEFFWNIIVKTRRHSHIGIMYRYSLPFNKHMFSMRAWPGYEVERSETNSPMCPSMFYSRYTTPKHTQEAHSLNGSICYTHTHFHTFSLKHTKAKHIVRPLNAFYHHYSPSDYITRRILNMQMYCTHLNISLNKVHYGFSFLTKIKWHL